MILQLIGCAAALIAAYLTYLYLDDPPLAPRSTESASLPSLLIPCITLHRRFLPVTAVHHFSYPLIYLGLDLEALEARRLDRGVFKYDAHPLSALLTVSRKPYLSNPKTKAYVSLREELLELVNAQGVNPAEIGRIWLVTMPSYFGFTGINPLTVWYLYGKAGAAAQAGEETPRTVSSDDEEWVKSGFGEAGGKGSSAGKTAVPDDCGAKLKAVVLEVHNTFGERHIYVLRVGHNEEPRDSLAPGLHHAWTFPRTFHVSPFNNRAGFYRLDLVDPFLVSATQPKVRVTLSLLTKDKQRKIYAVLAGNPSAERPAVPITSAHVLRSIVLRQPFDLFLTTPRILAQAWTLHFEKRLSVYPRPELDRKRTSDEDLDAPWNPSEEDEAGTGRSIGWKPSGSEKQALKLVSVHLERMCKQLGKTVSIFFDNPGMPSVSLPSGSDKGEVADLVIRTRHPTLFTEILMARTPDQILLSAEVDRHTLISSPDLFRQMFASPVKAPAAQARTDLLDRATDRVRERYLFFHTSFALRPLLPALIMHSPHFTIATPYTLLQRLSMYWLLLTAYWGARAEEWIMYRMDAQFVAGQAPWEGMRRIGDHIWGKDIDDHKEAVANDKFGSVRTFVDL